MRTMSVKIEVDGNNISFSNTYLSTRLRGNLYSNQVYNENKLMVGIRSIQHPQLTINYGESGKVSVIKLFMKGKNRRGDGFVSTAKLYSDGQIEEVVGFILLSLAKLDIEKAEEEKERESVLIINGMTIKMDTEKQLKMARYLLGGAV